MDIQFIISLCMIVGALSFMLGAGLVYYQHVTGELNDQD